MSLKSYKISEESCVCDNFKMTIICKVKAEISGFERNYSHASFNFCHVSIEHP